MQCTTILHCTVYSVQCISRQMYRISYRQTLGKNAFWHFNQCHWNWAWTNELPPLAALECSRISPVWHWAALIKNSPTCHHTPTTVLSYSNILLRLCPRYQLTGPPPPLLDPRQICSFCNCVSSLPLNPCNALEDTLVDTAQPKKIFLMGDTESQYKQK